MCAVALTHRDVDGRCGLAKGGKLDNVSASPLRLIAL